MGKLGMRMWGYLPAAAPSPQRAPPLLPSRMPWGLAEEVDSVCGGGCGFALAITESGKIMMWGSANDLGQSNALGRNMPERIEPYQQELTQKVVQAAGGWAHSVAVTDKGDICQWGWSACAPSIDLLAEERGNPLATSLPHQRTEQIGEVCRGELPCSNEIRARVKGPCRFDKIVHSLKQSVLDMEEGPSDSNDNVISLPMLVSVAAGVIIKSVAAGARHTLAVSNTGKVWGWGYGEEGQLGLGSRVHKIPRPELILDLQAPLWTGNGSSGHEESDSEARNPPPATLGTCVSRIACGGRHSAVLTDTGAVMTFGWGLYGQCCQGSTEDQLSPVYVSAMGGIKVTGLSAGIWHTVLTTDEGDVYSAGGNQFGQLGTLGDQAEMLPTLVDAPVLENETAISVSCGARHTSILTENGKIFSWGWNKYGQLGTGDTIDRDAPVEVPLDRVNARSVACGWWHTLALVEEHIV